MWTREEKKDIIVEISLKKKKQDRTNNIKAHAVDFQTKIERPTKEIANFHLPIRDSNKASC